MSDPTTSARSFTCRNCGRVYAIWSARCPDCREWGLDASDTFVANPTTAAPVDVESPTTPRPRLVLSRVPEPELTDPVAELVDIATDGPVPITEIAEATFVRDETGLSPLDYVLGGGLVVGSIVLLASPRGIGKTSLSLQMLAGLKHHCLYVTGEETREQLAATARRIGALTPHLHVLAERNLTKIFADARAMRARAIVIDSIQKMRCDEVGGRAGSPVQLKECTAQLVDYAKYNDAALWLIGHVTGEGDIAGPKTIEHEVDVVLELTKGEKFGGKERVLRCLDKNRFGESDRVGYFKLTAEGLVSADGDGWDEEEL